jgi:DNA-binding transcriptional regulator YiaG
MWQHGDGHPLRRVSRKEAGAGGRQEKGLLSPEEIKGIRKSLGLKQHDFETLIGVSSPTASRWETGAMLPSKTTDTLIRVLAEFPEVVEFLSSRNLDATLEVDASEEPDAPVPSVLNERTTKFLSRG